MVTITLHDQDAVKALCALKYVQKHNPSEGIERAIGTFQCALLLCDHEKRAPEVLRMEREPRAVSGMGVRREPGCTCLAAHSFHEYGCELFKARQR